jgi:hypothetical protein
MHLKPFGFLLNKIIQEKSSFAFASFPIKSMLFFGMNIKIINVYN